MPRFIDPGNYPVTLDSKAIAALPVYTLPTNYTLGSPSMGCHMDPPGYPTYYTQPVYYRGNTPRNAPDAVIMGPDGELRRLDRVFPKSDDWKAAHAESDRLWDATIRRLWAPLPLDHARTDAWIRVVFGCFKTGWILGTSRNVADLKFRPLDNDDARRLVAGTLPRTHNGQQVGYHAAVDVRTYRSVDYVLAFYPDTDPTALFESYLNRASYGKTGVGDWWTTEDERPTPETCPGMRAAHGETWPAHDPKGCQFCGY